MFAIALLASACAGVQKSAVTTTPRPLVIAHRGASGERPEHTIASYTRAIADGADYIEPDLVPTKDGVLVARHENEIGGTTDVADRPEFAARRTTKTIDGADVTGWFTEDFTLAELKTLHARERLPQLRPANAAYCDERVPTFAEVVALAKAHNVGVYPETKHPTYFASIGLATDAPLLAMLRAAGWDRADAPVFVQSFEVANLGWWHAHSHVRLIQLIDARGGPSDGAAASYAAMTTPDGLAAVARYAYGLGPNKAQLWQGDTDVPSTLVRDAHAAGLRVHPWTYRAEGMFLPTRYRRGEAPGAHGDVAGEIAAALRQGIDGFFTDFPAIGVQTRNAETGR